ncbi:MAG: tRNA1(Val) (adenine(37)-N6)-methyltransferase [Thermodesulfobacteriota bacterium]
MARRITADTLFDGRLHCLQHKDGYRFSVDAVLLAHFITPAPGAVILDLGAGCGVVSLILCYRHPGVRVTALELQAGLVELIRRNVEVNGLADRLAPLEGDMRTIQRLIAPEGCDWVVVNPPYGRPAAGRVNDSEESAVARHELRTSLAEVVAAIAHALKNRGRAALVYPAARLAALLAALKEARLEPKRLRIVYSYPGGEGRLALVEVVKNGGEELTVLPPFFVYEKPGGAYSDEMASLYAP